MRKIKLLAHRTRSFIMASIATMEEIEENCPPSQKATLACTKRFGLPDVQGLWQARALRHWMPVLRSSCRYSYGGWKCDGKGYPSKLVSSVMGYASEGSALFEACGGAMGFSP